MTSTHHPFGSSFGPGAVPDRAGVGLRAGHYGTVTENRPDIGWFEVHPENYMCAGGPRHAILETVRRDYPVSLHGVGLSIGGAEPLDRDHLAAFRALVDRYRPGLVSEHLAWSRHCDAFYDDLLPLPLDETTLQTVAEHVDEIQGALARQVLIENPATYVSYANGTMGEIDFLSELVLRTGCGLLLDVNNVYVSATNHGYSAEAYLDAFPGDAVGEIHLAGHTVEHDRNGEVVLIDTHNDLVADPVWALYRRIIGRIGARPTLIEWDADLPDWPVLHGQAMEADRLAALALAPVRVPAE